jgi:septal ring factor EnvC (AmiA/AmiB activator)
MLFFRVIILLHLFLLSVNFLNAQKHETSLFEKSKGKLTFPVCAIYGYNDSRCFDYGNLIPGSKNITFITDSAAEVRAIYNGKVYKVFSIENAWAVVTNFGDYFITYYPVKQTRLKKGDTIISGQPISKVGYLENDREINILISKRTNFIDPYKWFRW